MFQIFAILKLMKSLAIKSIFNDLNDSKIHFDIHL